MTDVSIEEDALGIPRGTVFGERYRIDRPLTAGGMGTVFVADDLKYPGRTCAVKVMASGLLKDGRSRARFEQEALIGRALKHANIVDVFAAGVDPVLGSPWIAMELLEGGTLTAIVAERGPLPQSEVRELMGVLGSALAVAHQTGVVHRDLKPDNLFLTSRPSRSLPYTVKILDFGIAKVKKDVTTMNSQLIGSPLWMAPEQLSPGTPIGNFTDVWPFALITFYAITGKNYWLVANEPASNLPKLLAEIIVAELAPPSVRAAQLGVTVALPPAFDAWFLQSLRRETTQRYATIEESTAALDAALAPAPVEIAPVEIAPPVAAPEPSRPPASRAPHVAALGIVALVALALAWALLR